MGARIHPVCKLALLKSEIVLPSNPVRKRSSLASKFSAWLAKSLATDGSRKGVTSIFADQDGGFVLDATCAARLIRAGLLASHVWELVPLFGLSTKEELLQVLSASDTSLRRWAGKNKALPTPIVEKILRIMQLQLIAADVFGQVDLGRVWLRRPHPMLDGLAPGDYADNEYGAGQVRGMLAALKHGGVV